MYGGEIALRILLDHLAYVERGEERWSAERQAWKERGAFTPTGVTGAFAGLVAGHYEYGVASVYSEFARVQGWLQADRTLTPQKHRELTATLDAWAAQDRKLSEVEAALGPPSILFGGNNPLYGKTLSYLTGALEEPMVSFHFWNGPDSDTGPQWPPAYTEPVLLAVRVGGSDFGKSFTFTPEGQRRRPT